MNKKCQIFTPTDYVHELLDNIGYRKNLYGKKILENSCGDGNILMIIVERYILDCKRKGFSGKKIREGLRNDIYGIEIDREQYDKCIKNLNNILSIEDIKPIKWNIINFDYLKWEENVEFDFIVGNPPYITYRDLDDKNKKYIKNNFLTCREGKFDYCYAFIEKSINSLKYNGKMSYLIPSSIFKTVFGKNLRIMMKNYIIKIFDYTEERIFDNALKICNYCFKKK